MLAKTQNLTIIIPSYQEDKSLKKLLPEIVATFANEKYSLTLLVVNDLGERDFLLEKLCAIHNAVVLNTPYNMGSQEAIVYGIREQVENFRSDFVLVMDADGQDNIQEVFALLNEIKPNTITVAQRIGKRPEGIFFSFFYFFYKKIFYYLTDVTPNFGNFSAFDQSIADKIAQSPYFNITYSMALPLIGEIRRIPVKRLKRIRGKSRIGYQGLFNHAMRSTLPYLNVIALKVAFLSLIPTFTGFILVSISSFLRVFSPEYAFPNWATTISFGVVMMSLQLFTICLILFLTASLYRQIAFSKSGS